MCVNDNHFAYMSQEHKGELQLRLARCSSTISKLREIMKVMHDPPKEWTLTDTQRFNLNYSGGVSLRLFVEAFVPLYNQGQTHPILTSSLPKVGDLNDTFISFLLAYSLTLIIQQGEEDKENRAKKILMYLQSVCIEMQAFMNYVCERKTSSVEEGCIICMDRRREYACVPCGHLGYCKECVMKLKECSTCRKEISSFCRIYSV